MEEKKLTQLNYTEIWENAKKLIVNKTSALTFDVWIKALEPIGVRGDALILMSKSEGAKSVILKSYSDIITSSIKECTSELSSFELVVEDDEDAKEIISQNEKINDELNKKEFLKPKEKYSNNALFHLE